MKLMGNLFRKYIVKWKQERSGATAVEYGLLVAALALAILLAVFTFGEDMRGMLSGLAGYLDI